MYENIYIVIKQGLTTSHTTLLSSVFGFRWKSKEILKMFLRPDLFFFLHFSMNLFSTKINPFSFSKKLSWFRISKLLHSSEPGVRDEIYIMIAKCRASTSATPTYIYIYIYIQGVPKKQGLVFRGHFRP